ncbi:hypothetical protein ACFGVR_11690 [Mucilaginibacter sp. AW1-3]
MKKYYTTKLQTSLSITLPLFFLLLICGCKKDAYREVSTNEQVQLAKAWYQGAYPTSTGTNVVVSAGQTTALYRLIKPGWDYAKTYTRLSSDVIEMPIDSSQRIDVGDIPGQEPHYNTNSLSRSSFLILNHGGTYSAFIMTVIADPGYIKNDYSKLARNTYQKRDADFSGTLLYSTPTGKLIKGWQYKSGKIVHTLSTGTAISNRLNVQGIGGGLKTEAFVCTDWYADYYVNDAYILSVFLGTTCADDGSGTPADHNPDGGSGGGGSGFPPPDGGGGGSNSASIPLQIREDSLKAHFPCATKLIIDSLLKIPGYANLVAGFNTPVKPNLTFRDSIMDWNKHGSNGTDSTLYGLTGRDTAKNAAASSVITLNTRMLQNSSQLLITSVVIHETIHAVINYNIVYAGYNLGYGDSWMSDLNSWYLIKGLPNNFADHYAMMDYYFNSAIAILAKWDNNKHTAKEYEMAMLTGLNNPGVNTGSDPNYATEVQLLQTEYDSLKAKYNISESDLTSFLNAQNNTSAATKLPASGCN